MGGTAGTPRSGEGLRGRAEEPDQPGGARAARGGASRPGGRSRGAIGGPAWLFLRSDHVLAPRGADGDAARLDQELERRGGLGETISDNCVVIFSKTSCSYCTMAKKLFHDINVNYKVVELDMLEYGSQFQDALYKMTGDRTVPRIFVNGTFIGGATDTHRLHKEGKLLPLVQQCYLKKSEREDFS
nr:glutaredoxin 2 isoform X1 [Equus caballus]